MEVDSVDADWDAPVGGEPDSFETGLRGFLDSDAGKKHRLKSKRLLHLLDAPRTRRRQRKLDQLKAHLAVHLHEVGVVGSANPMAIDWSQIDWAAIWAVVLKVLEFVLAILPLFV